MSAERAARFALVDDTAAKRVAVRLMSKLRTEGECWVWTGSRLKNGYGVIRLNRAFETAHVVAMFLRHGAEALTSETVNHLCFNRACCNPDHLQFASIRENVLHGNGLTAKHAAKTHCIRGHAFTPENIYPRRGGRECRQCQKTITRTRQKQKRAQLRKAAA